MYRSLGFINNHTHSKILDCGPFLMSLVHLVTHPLNPNLKEKGIVIRTHASIIHSC